MEGARIGIPWSGILSEKYPAQSLGYLDLIVRASKEYASILESIGAIFIWTSFSSIKDSDIKKPSEDIYTDVYQNPDSILAVNNYLQNLDPNSTIISTFSDVINGTINDPHEQYLRRDISYSEAAQELKVSPSSPEAWEAYQHVYRQCGSEGGIFGALKADDLDALILPSCFSFLLPAYAGSLIVTAPMSAFGDDVKIVRQKKDNPHMRSALAGPNMTF